MDLSWHNTDQVRPWLHLTYFYMRYCPLLSVCLSVHWVSQSTRFSEFFSVVLWDIDLNFGKWICLDIIQIKFNLVAFDLLLHELLPFVKISFSELFFVIFQHIELKFHIWICLDIIQVKFNFGLAWPTFSWVIALCKNLVFRTFFSCLVILTWHFGIWICLDIIQIKFNFYCVWRIAHKIFSFL